MAETTVHALMPDAEALLALQPEELAGVVLQFLNTLPDNAGSLNRYNFGLSHTVQDYPSNLQDEISRALMEAWMWLEREGLLAPKPGSHGDWMFVTRRGRQLATAGDLRSYRRAGILPHQFLHPRIAQKTSAAFLRGDYDVAVFQAFKEVEVQVRDASRAEATTVGVDLMRRAFHPSSGVLTDQTAPPAEREALASLFAGAIGSYKNPHSHRHVAIEAHEAAEMIVLASHLLGIVDQRRIAH